MFEKDRVFYKSEDYTVRFERIGGCERYYLKFHGQTADTPEQEITIDVFMLYYKEFRKPFDKKRNEQKRHIEDGEVDGFIMSGKLTVKLFEQEYADKAEIEVALNTCTAVQQRRFKLHYVQGYSLTEIAKMEKCDLSVISRSVSVTLQKMKNYFS